MTNRSNKTKRCAPAKASKYFKLSSAGAEGAVPRAFAGITHKGRTPKQDTNVRVLIIHIKRNYYMNILSPVRPTKHAPTIAPAHWVQSVP